MSEGPVPMNSLGLSGRRLAKNTASRTAASAISLAAGAISGLLVARALGPDRFGSFSVVWAIAWAAALAVPLGFDQLLVRELNRRPPLLDPVRALRGVSGFAIAVAGGLIALAWVAGIETRLLEALAAGAVYVAASAPLALAVAVFDARERMEFSALVLVVEALAALGGIVLALANGGGVVAVSGALAIARIGSLAIAGLLLTRAGGLAFEISERRSWRTLLAASLPMSGSRLLNDLVRRLDVVLLGLLVAADEVGLFAAAAALVINAPTLLLEFNKSLYPILSRAESTDDHDLLHVFGLTWRSHLVIGTTAAAGLAVLGAPLVGFLYGEGYTTAGRILVVLAWIVPLRVLGGLCAVTLDATYRQKRRLVASAVAVGVKVPLAFALIPPFGLWGAAVAALTADIVMLAGLLRGLRPYQPHILRPLAESALVAIPVALAANLVPGHVLARTAAGLAVFALLAPLAWRRARAGHRLAGSGT